MLPEGKCRYIDGQIYPDGNFYVLDTEHIKHNGNQLKSQLNTLDADIDNKVDKETGKGLSTNDYTTADKNKLAGIEANANNYVHPTTSGNKHIPSGGSSGKILGWSADGTAAWVDPSGGGGSVDTVYIGSTEYAPDANGKVTLPTYPTTLPASDVYSWAKASTKPSYTASEVGAIATTSKGANNGVAELDSSGKVPSSQLPSYVDDVLEYSAKSSFPSTGETGKIYVDTSENKTYRWSGSTYTEISPSLALGETSSTAYRGDRGKTAYDHSQLTSGNPHNVTKSDVGLGNVGNFKAVSTVASQGLSDTEKSNARANIGAGTSSFSGSYNDLSGKPTLGTAAAKDVPSSGNASTSQVVMGNDSRLSDARTPTSHTHTKSQITDFPTSMTPTSHTHGNIQNGGTLQTNDIAIASGDKIIVTDSSDSNKIARTSISFDGSTATQALTKKGTWETFNNYSHPTSSGNKHIPSGGSSGQILRWSADGTAAWGSDNNTWTAMVGATSSANGSVGYVNAVPPKDGYNTKYLRADGSWQVPPNTTYSAATQSAAGLMSASDKTKLDGVATGATANIGTVTQVKVGTTAYNPSSGVVSLPAYPTTLPASDVSSWAKASTKPSYTYSEVGAAPSQHTHSSIESKGNYVFDATTKPNSLEYGISTGFVNRNSGYGSFGGVLNVRAYSGGGGTLQLYAPYSPTYGGTHLKARFGNYDVDQGNSWTELKDIAWVSDIPTSLPASDVYSWAKASTKPSYTYSEVGAAASSHTHNYAGSSSAGGVATSAAKLSNTSKIGDTNKPVYFKADGTPAAISYTIDKSVPSNAVFTDTTYSAATQSAAGLMSAADKTKLDGIATGANNYSLPNATTSSKGGVIVGSNLSVSNGTISMSSENVASALGYTPANNDGVNMALNVRVRCDQHSGTYGTSQTFRVYKTAERGVVLVICGSQGGTNKQSTILVFDIQQGILSVRRLVMGGNSEIVDGVTINYGSTYDDAIITYTAPNSAWPPVIIPLMPNDKTPTMQII